jgi:hypothetical protein
MPQTIRNGRSRHVHLGERLAVIERIQRGHHTVGEAAAEAGVPEEEVRRWIEVHAGDRIVTVDEVAEPEVVRHLRQRVQILVDMIGDAEGTITGLVRQLARR